MVPQSLSGAGHMTRGVSEGFIDHTWHKTAPFGLQLAQRLNSRPTEVILVGVPGELTEELHVGMVVSGCYPFTAQDLI